MSCNVHVEGIIWEFTMQVTVPCSACNCKISDVYTVHETMSGKQAYMQIVKVCHLLNVHAYPTPEELHFVYPLVVRIPMVV